MYIFIYLSIDRSIDQSIILLAQSAGAVKYTDRSSAVG